MKISIKALCRLIKEQKKTICLQVPHGDNNIAIPIKNERQIANPNHDQLGTPSKLSLLNKITKANSTLHPSTES